MQIVRLTGKKGKKAFLDFRAKLYKGDENYVYTDTFVLEDFLNGGTKFVRACETLPIAAMENGKILAQAILTYNARLPYAQIAFFDALEGQLAAVDLILEEARAWKRKYGAKGIIVGLNGHISYGVGILTEGFSYKNSFDSIYNKPYYKEFFKGLRAEGLSTYKQDLDVAISSLSRLRSGKITIRKCSLSHYEEEMKRMQALCEKTIAHTNLYFQTDEEHFFELTRSLKPFLKEEDLLFAEDERGETVGFLFSHPDFNQMLKGGRAYSLLGIACSFLFRRRAIDTVIINAIGSVSLRATYALLRAFAENVRGKYEYIETTFIWNDNKKSSAIANKLLGEPYRSYEVYYLDESQDV